MKRLIGWVSCFCLVFFSLQVITAKSFAQDAMPAPITNPYATAVDMLQTNTWFHCNDMSQVQGMNDPQMIVIIDRTII